MTLGNFFFSSSGGAAYEIEQSLRFDNGDSAHLHRTPSSAGSQTTFTLSVWVKSSVPSSGAEYFYATHNGSRWNGILRRSGNYDFGVDESGGSAPKVVTNAKLRDASAWYHLVMAYDTTQATSTDRVKIWINGELQSINTGAGSYPNLNHGSTFNRTTKHWIGALDDTASVYYTKDFYLAEYHLLDGTAVANAEDFGEYDDNGVWRPIEVTGLTYGTNGFYLKFDPSATNGIGHDHSGNGNNWTATGFTTSGTDTNVMSDTPTNNFATWNPLAIPLSGSPTFAEGNLYYDLNDSGSTISTIGVKSGKWYCEIRAEGTMSQRPIIGLNYINPTSQGEVGDRVWPGWDVAYAYNGNKWLNYATSSYGTSWSNGDIIGIALDLDSATQTVTFYRNGTSQGAINLPASGKTWHVSVSSYGVDGDNLAFTANFGQRAFEQTQPTGYNSWCTANLPAPDIADGSDYFNSVIYAPDGSSSFAVTGVGFQPDLVWIKSRNYAEDHQLNDAVRGATKGLQPNNTNAETTQTNGLTSFDSDGFTVGNLSDYNYNGDSIISWNWKAGGSGSSNTAGSITSTVSANPTAGCSIVGYTGTGTAGTVGHGLGVAPAMIWVKNRDNSAAYWPVYHHKIHPTSAPETLKLELNSTAERATADFWNNTAPTSTVFSVKDSNKVNSSGEDFIAYCFAEVEGYSKFGSYTGNGSADGPFIYTGFAPAMVILKSSSNANSWRIMDRQRDSYNLADKVLVPDSDASENTNSFFIDFLSNGFKVRDAGGQNINGWTNLWAAFAENPFGGDGVSPATAR